MTEKDIRDMLGRYKSNAGRIKHLEVEAKELRAKIEKTKADEVDAAAGPHPANIDGMPRGNRKSDPTGKLGAKLADGKVSKDVAAMMEKLAGIETELQTAINEKRYCDAWISSLMDRERLVLVTRVVEGRTWGKVADEYAQRYGDEMSERTLMRMVDNAVRMIWTITEGQR